MDIDYFSNKELREMGFKKLGKRVLICRTCKIYHTDQIEIGDDVEIDDFTILNGTIKIGNHIHISSNCELYSGQSSIEIADFCGISSHCSFYGITDDYVGPYMNNPTVPPRFRNLTEAPIVLDKHVLIATHCVVLPGVHIGEGCSFGAMSMISRNCDPWGVYVGCPAKRIKERDKGILDKAEELIAGEAAREARIAARKAARES